MYSAEGLTVPHSSHRGAQTWRILQLCLPPRLPDLGCEVLRPREVLDALSCGAKSARDIPWVNLPESSHTPWLASQHAAPAA